MKGGGYENKEYKKGLWTIEEDRVLSEYVTVHGKGKWNRIATETGLKRCGKSCRLRWINYLSPAVKRGQFSEEEEDLIIRLHKLLGNRWSLIAGRVPGRTDNQVKNYWNTRLSKKLGAKKVHKNKEATISQTLSSLEKDKDYSNPLVSNLSELPNSSNVMPEVEMVSKSEDGSQLLINNNNTNNNNNNNIFDDDNFESSIWLSCAEDYFIHPISSLDFWDIGM